MNTALTANVRREVRIARCSMSPKTRARLSRTLVRHMAADSVLWSARRVACFWPSDGEVDLKPLFKRLWQRRIQVLLPVIAGKRLWFAPYTSGAPMRNNRFGIAEPTLARSAACALHAIDLILVPLVAFDAHGNRLGMGGGYYDRTLAALRNRAHQCRPRLLGTAFEFQHRQDLVAQPWDIPMHGVVTEKGLRWFSRHAGSN